MTQTDHHYQLELEKVMEDKIKKNRYNNKKSKK